MYSSATVFVIGTSCGEPEEFRRDTGRHTPSTSLTELRASKWRRSTFLPSLCLLSCRRLLAPSTAAETHRKHVHYLGAEHFATFSLLTHRLQPCTTGKLTWLVFWVTPLFLLCCYILTSVGKICFVRFILLRVFDKNLFLFCELFLLPFFAAVGKSGDRR